MNSDNAQRKDSIKFLADKKLFYMAMVLLGIFDLVCLPTILFDKTLSLDAKLFVLSLFMIYTITSICVLPQQRIIIELSESGISYKPTFKKKIQRKYTDFGYFNCASYTFYKQEKYIVFSQRRLSDYELTHINNVRVSDKLIKIKVTKGLKEKLTPLLPPKYLCRIPKDFW